MHNDVYPALKTMLGSLLYVVYSVAHHTNLDRMSTAQVHTKQSLRLNLGQY